ncbi:hypothetical protein Tco_0285601 [Tanacetum coccineum]
MHLELSASSMSILIVSSFPIPRRLYIEKGMMLMLAPKSAKALLKSNLPIEQGRIKLPGSFSFGGSWLRRRAEHLRFILMFSFSMVNGLLATSSSSSENPKLAEKYSISLGEYYNGVYRGASSLVKIALQSSLLSILVTASLAKFSASRLVFPVSERLP